tara:strand:+ start:5598 stop:6629 length:1032 start_codon:yes stop_codon:yes gene_type:complete
MRQVSNLFNASGNPGDQGSDPLDIERDRIEKAFKSAARRYIATRRTRVAYFSRRHFSLRGAIRLHRVALGGDLVRAPVNLALAVPHLLKLLLAAVLRRLGKARTADWLAGLPTQLQTAVAREIDWLMWTELLELPHQAGERISDRDALAEALLAEPEIARAMAAAKDLAARHRDDAVFNARLTDSMSRYTGARVAAAEIATALASAGVGGLVAHQLTPTAFTLGPVLAALFAEHAAILAFPLGTGLGGAWYALFPAEPTWDLVAAVTVGLLALSSVIAAFAGIVADPVQRAFGIHRRRLDKLIDSIEADLLDGGAGKFRVRAHYVARLFDFFEAVRLASRAAL